MPAAPSPSRHGPAGSRIGNATLPLAGTGFAARVRARGLLLAIPAGAGLALALPPFTFLPALLGLSVLFWLTFGAGPRRALALGWSFGFGYFIAGLYWITISFTADIERFGALIPIALLLLGLGFGLFPALACALTARLNLRSASGHVLTLSLALTASEWLRGHLLTGFPWNLVGYAWDGFWPAQTTALFGVYGLTLLTFILAGSLALPCLIEGPRRFLFPAVALLGLITASAYGGVRLQGAPEQMVEGVRLRLVQGNVEQQLKWDPAHRERWFERHLQLSISAPERPAQDERPVGGGEQIREAGPTHVIWPESATPYLVEEPAVRAAIARIVPEDGLALVGGNRIDLEPEPGRAWNSLFVVDPAGALVATYDKFHLVPFGEYLPLRGVLSHLGLRRVTGGTLDFEAGPGLQTLDLPGLPPVGTLICYETIFSGRVAGEPRPAWLLNITNDAWFGDSTGPHQHLAMARMRAIEEGLPIVRAANTGISAVFDAYGREVARLDLGVTGTIDSALPEAIDSTPFARLGHMSLVFLAFLASLASLLIERRLP